MPKFILTDDHRLAIMEAPDTETTSALASRLGISYDLTYAFREQLRTTGWICQLRLGTCDVCGQPLLASARGHAKRHRRCRADARAQRSTQLRRADDAYRSTVYARARERRDSLQEVTRGLDVQSGDRWSAEDDAYLWEHRADVYTSDGIERLARTLGRSFSACQNRLTWLMRHHPNDDPPA